MKMRMSLRTGEAGVAILYPEAGDRHGRFALFGRLKTRPRDDTTELFSEEAASRRRVPAFLVPVSRLLGQESILLGQLGGFFAFLD
jgi:hypothetical protein